MTSRGSMTTETFVNWLTYVSPYKFAGSCLLVFDGATSHLDHSTVKAADRHDITLLCLPTQTIHKLQPMDKSVFGPLENIWNEHFLLFYSLIEISPSRDMTRFLLKHRIK